MDTWSGKGPGTSPRREEGGPGYKLVKKETEYKLRERTTGMTAVNEQSEKRKIQGKDSDEWKQLPGLFTEE